MHAATFIGDTPLRPSRAQYIIPGRLAHADPLTERIERWSRENLASDFSLQDAANALSVNPRTLQRRTEAVLGKSPLAFFQDMRVERVQHLISIGHDLEKYVRTLRMIVSRPKRIAASE
jgi:transcriptional regulator GlxA family with amidase domain